jgi:hypothetical protein
MPVRCYGIIKKYQYIDQTKISQTAQITEYGSHMTNCTCFALSMLVEEGISIKTFGVDALLASLSMFMLGFLASFHIWRGF